MSSGGDSSMSIAQVSPNTSPSSTIPPHHRVREKHYNSTSSLVMAKRDSSSSLPTHLISSTTHTKSSSGAPIKQQLPMKLAKLGTAGSSGSSSSSMSSSLSSSMSTGGSMSPSQDRVVDMPVQQRTYPSPISGIQQMLPLKLSENISDKSRSPSSGYQRLASPPPTVIEPASNPSHILSGPAHQRTGSSPASLQNGAPVNQQSTITTTTSPISQQQSNNPRAVRTNTYPKISNKPTVTATRAASEASRSRDTPTLDLSSNTKPGQRIKDPDSNQDILFF